MKIINIPISDVYEYENNPRRNDDAVQAVTESIKQCGYCSPIIVDENHVILAGHTRYKAIIQLGWTEVQCVVVAGMTEEQKRKFRLLDNKTGELAEWDFELLAAELEELDFGDFDFDFEAIDDIDYIDELIQSGVGSTKRNDKKWFSSTFTFDIADKPAFDAFVSERGKDTLTRMICQIVRGERCA